MILRLIKFSLPVLSSNTQVLLPIIFDQEIQRGDLR